MRTIQLFEWADDGGPGGTMALCDWRQDGSGANWGRPHQSENAPWSPWPKSYIQLGPTQWAKYWRYCVHAPGDPLFLDAEQDLWGLSSPPRQAP